jgi:hypothetical protein
MQFNGVVGRSSLPVATTLTNPNNRHVAFEVKISGTDFHATSTTGQIEKVQTGDNTADVSVQYVPTKPGTTHGLLHIVSTFDEQSAGQPGPAVEQDLELIGTATELAHPKPAPSDGSPRPIPDLGAEAKSVAPRQQIKDDLDALSGLAETYTTIVGANDIAAAAMIERIYAAKFQVRDGDPELGGGRAGCEQDLGGDERC